VLQGRGLFAFACIGVFFLSGFLQIIEFLLKFILIDWFVIGSAPGEEGKAKDSSQKQEVFHLIAPGKLR